MKEFPRDVRRGTLIWVKPSIRESDFFRHFDPEVLEEVLARNLPFISGFDSSKTWCGINRNKTEFRVHGVHFEGPEHSHVHVDNMHIRHFTLDKPILRLTSKADLEALYG